MIVKFFLSRERTPWSIEQVLLLAITLTSLIYVLLCGPSKNILFQITLAANQESGEAAGEPAKATGHRISQSGHIRVFVDGGHGVHRAERQAGGRSDQEAACSAGAPVSNGDCANIRQGHSLNFSAFDTGKAQTVLIHDKAFARQRISVRQKQGACAH